MRLAALGVVLLGADLVRHRAGPSASLLAGKQPARAEGVANPLLLTDGRQASDGEDWNAAAAAVLQAESRLRRLRPRAVGADRRRLPAGRQQRRLRRQRLGRRPASASSGSRARSPSAGLRGRAADGLGGQGALDPAVRARRRPRLLGDRAAALEPAAGDVPARIPRRASPELRRPACARTLIYLVLAFALCCSRRARAGGALDGAALAAPVVAAVLTARAIGGGVAAGGPRAVVRARVAAAIVLLALLRGWARVRAAPPHRQDGRRRVRVRARCWRSPASSTWDGRRPGTPARGARCSCTGRHADLPAVREVLRRASLRRRLPRQRARLRRGRARRLARQRWRRCACATCAISALRPAGELTDEIAKVRRQFTPERLGRVQDRPALLPRRDGARLR